MSSFVLGVGSLAPRKASHPEASSKPCSRPVETPFSMMLVQQEEVLQKLTPKLEMASMRKKGMKTMRACLSLASLVGALTTPRIARQKAGVWSKMRLARPSGLSGRRLNVGLVDGGGLGEGWGGEV